MWKEKQVLLKRCLLKKRHFLLQGSSEICFSFTLFNAHNSNQYSRTPRLRQNRVEKCVNTVPQQRALALARGRIFSQDFNLKSELLPQNFNKISCLTILNNI